MPYRTALSREGFLNLNLNLVLFDTAYMSAFLEQGFSLNILSIAFDS